MAAPHRQHDDDNIDDLPETLDADDALEEIDDAADGGMDIDDDEDDDREEIILQNDSIAYFDAHKGSVFAIAQHPTIPSLIATGGGEGDEDDAPGKGYVFDTSAVEGRPVLPASYSSDPGAHRPRSTELKPLFAIDGHTDSVNALAFTLPRGEYLVSGGLDGRLRAYAVSVDARNKPSFAFVAEAQEVPEVNWVAACPSSSQYGANAVALGGSDGSVWVYALDAADGLQIVQTYFLHQPAPCTAGAWSPDGALLATVAEDGSLHVWDVWGMGAAAGAANDNGQTVVSLTGADARFAVEGGLYSVAIEPRGAFVAVGGAGGAIKIVGLPRLSSSSSSSDTHQAPQNSSRQSKAKAKGGSGSGSQAGVILADIAVQRDSVETLAFSPRQPLLAAGSVDGSIAVYDTARGGFAARKLNEAAHEEYSVVRVEFVRDAGDGWLLTSCGMDGAVRRWDARGGQQAAASAAAARPGAKADAARMVKEWRGHRGEGEGGGVLGFVQGATGERIVTAGDDGIALVFEA